MMVPQMPRLALAVALLLVAAIPARAQQPEWIRLGEQTLGVAGEVIPVGRQEGMFQRLKLESVRGTAFVRSLRITYVGGRSGEVPVGQSVGPGRGTDPILLPGGRGVAIEQIEIVARGEPGQGDGAVLRVLGEQADDQAPPVAPRVAEATGDRPFEELDAQVADLGSERVVLAMGRAAAGAARAIKVRVDGSALYIRRLEIVDDRDQSHDVRIGEMVEAGGETRVIALEGELEAAREVVVVIRPDAGRRGARLRLLGQRIAASSGAIASAPPRSEPGGGPRGTDIEADPSARGRLEPPPGTDRFGIPSGLVLLGSQRVGFRTGRDLVPVGPRAGVFDKVVMRVVGNDVFMREFTIVYADGERDRFPVNQEIRANSLTPSVRLKGDRAIREIELLHQSRPDRRGEATVEIYGEPAEFASLREPLRPPLQSEPPPVAPAGGWVMLGRQRAQMFADDVDTFVIGRQLGPIRALRLTAKRHAVLVFGLRVIYADGAAERIPLNLHLRDGETSEPIGLRGRERFVERVVVIHRSMLNFKGEGDVELWGLQ